MSIKQFLEVWGFTDKGKTVEESHCSLPTAGGKPFSSGDDGAGWKKLAGVPISGKFARPRRLPTSVICGKNTFQDFGIGGDDGNHQV